MVMVYSVCVRAVKYSATDVYDDNVKLKHLKVKVAYLSKHCTDKLSSGLCLSV